MVYSRELSAKSREYENELVADEAEEVNPGPDGGGLYIARVTDHLIFTLFVVKSITSPRA